MALKDVPPWQAMKRDDRISAIEVGVSEGLSAQQIAGRLKTTRSAICSYAARYKIKLNGGTATDRCPARATHSAEVAAAKAPVTKTKPTRKTAPKNKTGVSFGRGKSNKTRAEKPKEANPAPIAPTDSEHKVLFVDRTARQCTRPLWGDTFPGVHAAYVCGAPTEKPNSVCGACAKIVYQPWQRKPKEQKGLFKPLQLGRFKA